MDAQGYRAAIATLGMSRGGASRFLHIDKRKTLSFIMGKRNAPPVTAMLLSLMVKYELSPADVCRLAGLPVESYADRRRGRIHIGRKRRFVGKA